MREFKFSSINISDHAVCVEYFAYYKCPSDRPILNFVQEENENEVYSYLAIIIKGNNGQASLLNVKNIPLETQPDKDLGYLLKASADKARQNNEDKTKETVQCLNKIFVKQGKRLLIMGMGLYQVMMNYWNLR